MSGQLEGRIEKYKRKNEQNILDIDPASSPDALLDHVLRKGWALDRPRKCWHRSESSLRLSCPSRRLTTS